MDLLLRTLAWLVIALACSRAVAQEPEDIGGGWDGARAEVVLPTPPSDFVTEVHDGVRWTFPVSAIEELRATIDGHDRQWKEIATDLGADLDRRVEIRVARNPEEMAALAPVGHPPPGYAVGVAYPRFGVVLLTLTAPETWTIPNLEIVLAHELSHIALHRAAGGARLPRWFVEGVAIWQSGEASLERTRTLWTAAVSGTVLPLAELDQRFPNRPYDVNVAYAQSADLVGLLRADDTDGVKFRSLVRRVARGDPFDEAVLGAYDRSLATIESEWRAALNERFHALPLLITGGGLWGVAVVLLVLAWRRRRRDLRETLARWDAEERAAAIAEAPEEPVVVVVDVPREPGVPTIEHEGRSYTLH